MAIKFCLYYQTPETCDYLLQVISDSRRGVVVEAKRLAELPAQVNSGAQVIFLEYLKDHPELDLWIKKTAADPRNPPIFLYLQEISTEQLWKALRFGVKECFSHPIRPEEFQDALDRLPQFFPLLEPAGQGRIITLLGCKGGVGTTFLTVNLACLLAQGEGNRVLAVDLDLRYGQMVYFFDARPQYTLSEVMDNVAHLDDSYLKSLFFPWDPNLHLLPAPARLEEAEAITAEQLAQVLEYIKKSLGYTHILVDAGHHLDEISLKALELADQVVLVANHSLPALSNTRKLLEILELIGLGELKLEIWLNCWDRKSDLTVEEVGRFLGRKVQGTVAFDPVEVGLSINEGVPLAKSSPHLAVCQDLRKLAQSLMGESSPPPQGRFSRWNPLRFLKRS